MSRRRSTVQISSENQNYHPVELVPKFDLHVDSKYLLNLVSLCKTICMYISNKLHNNLK
jgi:hypothetical protein